MTEIKYTILYCVCDNFFDSFYYGSDSGTLTIYGSGSATAKSYGSYGSESGSGCATLPASTVPARVPLRWPATQAIFVALVYARVEDIFEAAVLIAGLQVHAPLGSSRLLKQEKK